jgi:ABC-type transport system substrate-binding protein
MTRRPRWWSLASLGATGVLVASMAGQALAQSPSAPAKTPYPDPAEQPPAPTADVTEYPNYGGEVDCEARTFNGRPYTGNLKKISAPDPLTVVFEFCNPNVAFLSQIAFSALGIDDAQYLIDHMPQSVTVAPAPGASAPPLPEDTLLTLPNGTGPYRVVEWDRGNRVVYQAYDGYWGEPARTPNFELRWSGQSAQRLVELQSGAVDGIDNPGRDDMAAIESNPDLALFPREGMNTFYLGFNNTIEPWDDVNVRRAIAMGIDRQRIVDSFYPPGSEVASHFTPCSIPFGCEGAAFDHPFDPEAAKALLTEAGITAGTAIKLQYRPAVRGYLPDPPTVAQDIASQIETNLGLTVEIEQQDDTTYLDNNQAGTLEGIFLLGWGADYPDTSNFLDYHFGPATGVKFGDPIPELVEAIRLGGQSASDEERAEYYATANDLINEHVPAVIVAHGGSGTAFLSDVDGGHSSPLSTEIFAVMQAGDRDTLVFMQNGEPGSLYCGDETDGESLRACEQVKESLYGYTVGGTDVQPSLATECSPNEELTVWTCTLREGVTFHDGSTFEASDVIVSFAAQWDNISPLHVGRTGSFEYWPALIGGGYLNQSGPCGLPNTSPCTN